MMNSKLIFAGTFLTLSVTTSVFAEDKPPALSDRGDRIENRLDEKSDRIERKDDRADQHLNKKGDLIDRHLDRQGERKELYARHAN
jgi:hypothetical protein